MAITAVVLAGGPRDSVAALQPDAPNKAFIDIAGKTLVERTIEGLRASSLVGRVIVVAPPSKHPYLRDSGLADELRPDGVKIRDSLRNGLTGLPPDDLVLVAASDMPVLHDEHVTDFIERARASDPDVGYGCVERRNHLARFPEVPHTWAPLRGGTYCGAGLFVIKPRAMPALERFIEQLGSARKNPLLLASLFGWGTLTLFALRLLSIGQAESRASHLLGHSVRAIVSPYPETAVNVDRVSDVPLAERLVGS
jgi:molybdopterin-guanine dinucleotide biosynthesis protein A